MSDTFHIPKLETGLYEHYKGNKYNVLGVGRHTEADDYFVVYAPLDINEGKPSLWLRPYDMFIGVVELNGETIPRFRKLNE